MRRLLVLAFIALAACRPEAPPGPQRPAAAKAETDHGDDAERASLTNIARGATIVSRTGEAFLGVAADATIDGNPGTFWANPPHDLPQSIVIAFPARVRIDRVGLRTARVEYTANHVSFDASPDGASWRPLTTITAAATSAAQWFPVTPADASFLRVTAVDGRPADLRLFSILAQGAELEPPHPGSLEGCWSVNGGPAVFEKRGGRIVGAVSVGREPIFLDGGGDGRVYRFVWIRGNDYGLALITVSPDGKHLTGLVWHEEAIPLFRADSWFGQAEACPAGGVKPRDDVPQALLERVGRYSAFGDYLPPGDRIVVHEFREPTAAKNKARAQQTLERLHRTGIAAGSDAPRQQPVTEPMRLLYSTVDVEIRR